MLVNVEGVWINPDHVSYLEVRGDHTVIQFSDDGKTLSLLPPDEVAAILNGGESLDGQSRFRDALVKIAEETDFCGTSCTESKRMKLIAQAALREPDDATE